MSAPAAAPDHQKKKHRGPRRRNAAASNPPKAEPSAPVAARVSQASQILAQLAAAQGSKATPALPAQQQKQQQPSTSAQIPSTPKAKETKPKAPKSEEKHKSVGARMFEKQQQQYQQQQRQQSHQPAPQPHQQRNRTTSQNYNYKMQFEAPGAGRGPKIPEDVLDSISFRFIMNIPDSERLDETRVCFQIELAHWFYIDFYVNQEERTDCINIGMRDFLKQIFSHNDFLRRMYHRADEILDNWRNYKSTVPTYGGILLDASLNHVLLVQGFYASKNSWGFPKGKVNESENPRAAAIREVLEETGFDFGEHSPPGGKEFKIQKMVNDTMIRLYVVKDVPMDYKFEPQTRCEIRKMKWFSIWDLPLDRMDQCAAANGFHPRHFYGVVPFVQDLQHYVRREEKRREKEGKAKKAITLSAGKKSSAFTKVEKKSPSERAWMESVAAETSGSSGGGGGVSCQGGQLVYGGEPAAEQSSAMTNETLFKPLAETGGAPPGSNLAMILANSSAGSTPRNAAGSSSGAGGGAGGGKSAAAAAVVAHPVAIRACDHPVYEAPVKGDKCKVAPASIAFPWDLEAASSLAPPSTASSSSAPSGSAPSGSAPSASSTFVHPSSSSTSGGGAFSAHRLQNDLSRLLFYDEAGRLQMGGELQQLQQAQLQQAAQQHFSSELVASLTPDYATAMGLPPYAHPPQPPPPALHPMVAAAAAAAAASAQSPLHHHHYYHQQQQRDSSLDGDEEVKECVPGLSQDPCLLPPMADLCVSFDNSTLGMSMPLDLPSTSSIASSTYRRPSVASSIMSPAMRNPCAFETVPAWKSFKLNRDAIFADLASVFM